MSIRFGILGAANIARSALIPAMHAATGARPYAVASRSLEKAQAFAQECELDEAFGSYEALLASPHVDAVYVALPIHVHKEWTIKALEAGKPVLCEKSLCMTSSDAIDMFSAAQKAGLYLQEVMAYRYHPMTRKIQELIAAGAIGDVKVVHADFHTPTRDPENIRLQKECGGGALRDLGVYCIDVNRFLFGADPIQVQAQQIIGATEVDMQSTGLLHFENGLGYFSCSLGTHYECHYEITGSAGRIRCPRGAMVAWGGEEFKVDLCAGETEEQLLIPAANPYQLMVEYFVVQVQQKTVLAAEDNSSVANLRAIEAVLASAAATAPVAPL